MNRSPAERSDAGENLGVGVNADSGLPSEVGCSPAERSDAGKFQGLQFEFVHRSNVETAVDVHHFPGDPGGKIRAQERR